nr:hypothetical protein [uncultured Carboxylicivirga sp.]
MKNLKFYLFAILMVITVCSCEKDDDSLSNPFIGTWKYENTSENWYDQYTFQSNLEGTYRFVDEIGEVYDTPFSYEFTESLIIIDDYEEKVGISYEIDGNSLIISNYIYYKQ